MKNLSFKKERIMWILALFYSVALAGLTVIRMFDNYIWGDEGFTINFSKLTLSEMCGETARDVHPPLYYIFAIMINRLFGDSVWVYHLLSVIPYVVMIVVALTFVWKKFGAASSFIFISFASLLQVSIKYNIEARMYSWAALFVFLAYCELYCIMQKEQWIHYILFGLYSLGAAYTHYYALLSVAFFYLFLLFRMFFVRKSIIKVLSICVATVLAYLPWLSILLNTFDRVSQAYWIEGIPDLWMCIRYTFATGKTWSGRSWTTELYVAVFAISTIMVVVYGLCGKGAFLFRNSLHETGSDEMGGVINNISDKMLSQYIIAGWAAIFGTVIVGDLVSYLYRPLLSMRYVYPVATVAWVLTGIAISRLKFSSIITMGLVILIIAVGQQDYRDVFAQEKKYDSMLADTLAQIGPLGQDDLILNHNGQIAWTVVDYYFPDNERIEYSANNLPELHKENTYWIFAGEELKDIYKEWLDSQGFYIVEVCHDGWMGDKTIYTYKLLIKQ